MQRDTTFYLLILEEVLLELRNFEAHQVQYAPKIAYIFHNVPALIQSNFRSTTGDEAFEVIRARAQALGLTDWVDTCERNALARMAQECHPGRDEQKPLT